MKLIDVNGNSESCAILLSQNKNGDMTVKVSVPDAKGGWRPVALRNDNGFQAWAAKRLASAGSDPVAVEAAKKSISNHAAETLVLKLSGPFTGQKLWDRSTPLPSGDRIPRLEGFDVTFDVSARELRVEKRESVGIRLSAKAKTEFQASREAWFESRKSDSVTVA